MLRSALALILMAATGALAQSPGQAGQPSQLTVRELHPKAVSPVFPLHAKTPARRALEFRSAEQMTAADRALAEANRGEIARRAGLVGLNMERGEWGYEQAVCPVFPGHLILEYSRGNGDRDLTLFAAVIPRGEGHVRVIPVRRRGYSLWTPASSSALTINDFNHMVTEGHEGLNPDWLTLGLCYSALAAGHVRAALAAQRPADEVFPLLAPATLTVEKKGGAEVHFSDTTAQVKSMDWVLEFDAKGRLVKVKHEASKEVVEKPVVGAPIEVSKY